jgi:inosine-uridine nucleoside N-ribohydrolase
MSARELERQHDLDFSMNHRVFAEPRDERDAPGQTDAVDLIIRTVEQHAGEIVLCCIAPLTNIATALQRKPEIAKQIKAIYLMGGEIAQFRFERNVGFDYNASRIVFAAGVPITMGTWSVTRQFTINMTDDCDRMRAHSDLGAAMADAIKHWQPTQSWKPGPVMYDIFPFIHAFDPSLYTMKQQSVQIETQGEHTRGWTIPSGDRKHIEVTTAINAEAVRKLYFDTVLR